MRQFQRSLDSRTRQYNNDAVTRMNLNQSMVWREPPVAQHPPVTPMPCQELETAPTGLVGNAGHPYDTRQSQVSQTAHGDHPSFSYH